MAPTVAAATTEAAATKHAVGLAARDASGHLAPLTITRRCVNYSSSLENRAHAGFRTCMKFPTTLSL
jgi:hypothetical protein